MQRRGDRSIRTDAKRGSVDHRYPFPSRFKATTFPSSTVARGEQQTNGLVAFPMARVVVFGSMREVVGAL